MQRHKHEQLRSHLLELIESSLAPHARLPTERDLANDFAVSRMTVRRALQKLEAERRVYRVQGAGTFVAEQPIAKTIELTSFTEDMRRRGLTPGGRLLLAEMVAAGDTVAFALGLSPAEPVVHLARVRTADAVPMCVENVYLASHLVPGLLDAYTENGSLYELLETRYRIRLEDADQSVRATVLDTANAQLLNVPPFTAALQVERTGYDQRGRAVEHATSLYRGDRYSYQISLHRNSG